MYYICLRSVLYVYYICIIYVLCIYYICIICVLYMYYMCIIYLLYVYYIIQKVNTSKFEFSFANKSNISIYFYILGDLVETRAPVTVT